MPDLKNEIFLSSLRKDDVVKFYIGRDSSRQYFGIVSRERDEFGKLDIEMLPSLQNDMLSTEITILDKYIPEPK